MKRSQLFMFSGAVLILALFFLPIWNITLEAPQYPTPLGMDIYINDFADTNPYDIKNINLMNHYVGMQYIPETIPEFKVFPIVVGVMSLIGILLSFLAGYRWYLVWFIIISGLSLLGVYDFYLWEHDYGHNLDPKAIMKFTNPDGTVMGFQPPLFGSKDILNFRAHSYPQSGILFLIAGMAASVVAFFLGKKEAKSKTDLRPAFVSKSPVVILVFVSFYFMSCGEVKPDPINYGTDHCSFCQMTIVDKTHSAQIVTKKGKVFKFDATECMINQLKDLDTSLIRLYLTVNYSNPEELIDATGATFLISNEIPSPMGANLSAFKLEEDAEFERGNHGGKIYSWSELLQAFKE